MQRIKYRSARVLFAATLLLLVCSHGVFAQKKDESPCVEATRLSSGIHRFRKEWESFDIAVNETIAGHEDCQAVSLELRWANGRNNGSNFNVTFVDSNNRPIYTRQLNGFLTGNQEFPLSLSSSVESRPWLGTPWMMAVPASITVQAVPPFAPPSTIYYVVIRALRVSRVKAAAEEESKADTGKSTNEIVKIRNAVRLIGSTRISLVLIDMKTLRPFPVKDTPVQLQIGKKVFLDELSGDYTGKNLTLTLTPAMFAELEDGAEVLAYFDEDNAAERWSFGKLDKKKLSKD